MGYQAHSVPGAHRTAIGVTGNNGRLDADRLLYLQGVKDVVKVSRPYRLVSREHHPEDTVVKVGELAIGDGTFATIAGPCSIESREQAFAVAEAVKLAGAKFFRGGAYKPRTSPYSFQGLGEPGLKILGEVRETFGLKIVTEAIDTETIEMVAECADVIQIGARSMQNYSLLKKAGRLSKPILLKRGLAATIEEFLLAAEYILHEGNSQVILCERGIRVFAGSERHLLDLSAIPYIKEISHLPIITDPSHGGQRRYRVMPLARASAAVGADGILIEVHHRPKQALSDGQQAITPDDFSSLMHDLQKIAAATGRALV
jgi:3-deoxy-7-phosphoheptulonate synthase